MTKVLQNCYNQYGVSGNTGEETRADMDKMLDVEQMIYPSAVVEHPRRRRSKGQVRRAARAARAAGLAVPIILFAGLLVFALFGHSAVQSKVKKVTVKRDGVSAQIETFDSTVADVIGETGVVLAEHDRVIPDEKTLLGDDATVVVERGREVTVVDGIKEPEKVITYEGTVGDLLEEQQIDVRNTDEVSAPQESEVVQGMTVQIDRITKEQKTRTQEVPFETEYRESSDLYIGEEKVTQEGVNGVRTIVEEIVFKNGEETGRSVISDTVTTAPVNRVITKGTKEKPATVAQTQPAPVQTPAQEPVQEPAAQEEPAPDANTVTLPNGDVVHCSNVISGTSTAYTHTGSRTATGVWPSVGTISVDPKVIPLGSRLYVSGYGYGIAQDTGGAIKGNIVDVFFDTEQECINWGRRNVTIYVLD